MAFAQQFRATRGYRHLPVLLLLFAFACSCLGREVPEHQVKAAFLFNFAAFVTWPDEVFESSTAPLRYCIQDADEVAAVLQRLLEGEAVDGRSLVLVRLSADSEPGHCHILYLGESEGGYDRLHQSIDKNVLTVGESEAFTDNGGMIALLRKRKRIHPVIRRDVVADSGLRLSSKLLRLATLVGPEEDR